MAVIDLGDWLDEQMEAPDALWYVKRLSGNDTQATGSHQAGPYVPLDIAYRIDPSLNRPQEDVTDCRLELAIDSHSDFREARLVRYQSKQEARITRLGGRSSALLDPEATGALAVFIFQRETQADMPSGRVWVCETAVDEDRVEDRIGPVEPRRWRTWPDLFTQLALPPECWLEPDEFPPDWLDRFPTGEEMLGKTVELRPELSADIDLRLIRRRDCEYDLFRSLEQAVELPRVREGYGNMDDFLAHAQSVLQRRKARSGNSLELHIRQILREEELIEGQNFDFKPQSEPNKEPDFLFPSAAAYHDPAFPKRHLRMLAVKTTLKDRWRQVLEEADRIDTKHLLTLQEGISTDQFREIEQAGLHLVVPKSLHQQYPAQIRQSLMTLESFLGEVRALAL